MCFALLCLSIAGCAQGERKPAPAATAPAEGAAHPTSPAAAAEMKQAGRHWSNCDIRLYYNRLISGIPAQDASLKQQGRSPEERARAAFDARHNARLTCRAMMSNQIEVDELRARDREKYGNPDGPAFEQLVEKNRRKGLQGDAVYDEIIASSQRTDEKVNQECGFHRP